MPALILRAFATHKAAAQQAFDDEQQIYAKLQYLFTPNTKLSVSYIDESRQYQEPRPD